MGLSSPVPTQRLLTWTPNNLKQTRTVGSVVPTAENWSAPMTAHRNTLGAVMVIGNNR